MKLSAPVPFLLLATALAGASVAGPRATAAAPGRPAATVFRVTEFGAVGDGTTLNTVAIQATIDAAARAGGGTVEVPPGTFLSGSIFLKSGVNLHLATGAVLRGSTNIADYPKRETRIEGHFEPWRLALVNAQQLDRVRINGQAWAPPAAAPEPVREKR